MSINDSNANISYRESHKQKGEDYHLTLQTNRLSNTFWDMEKKAISTMIKKHFNNGVDSYLDFACGTGRVIQFVKQFSKHSVGVDISASMLEYAIKNSPDVTFIEGDLTQNNILDDKKFDLISTFRFFPNAEQKLRDEVMAKLVAHLSPDGLVIFNNHLNKSSFRQLVFWRIKKGLFGNFFGKGFGHTMSIIEVTDLVESHGLEIVYRSPIGHLPMTEKVHIVPAKLMLIIESFLTKIIGSERLSQDIVYGCKLKKS